jgi:hypothetical protein
MADWRLASARQGLDRNVAHRNPKRQRGRAERKSGVSSLTLRVTMNRC